MWGSKAGRGRSRLPRFTEPGLGGAVVGFSTAGKAEVEIAGLSESHRRVSGVSGMRADQISWMRGKFI